MTQSPFSLTEKTILVTGASSGIGRETCIAISQMGGIVFATGRHGDRLAETMTLLEGDGHQSFAADLVNPEDRRQLIEKLPKLQGFVNSAGISRVVPLKYQSDALMDEMHQINFEAPVRLTRDLLKAKVMAPQSSIVFIGSIAAVLGLPGQCTYSASKGAIMALARVLATEVTPLKIRVNTVVPAMVFTPMLEGVFTPEQYANDIKAYPLGYGQPEDVAHTIVFFLSAASKWITGSQLIMDGGLTLK